VSIAIAENRIAADAQAPCLICRGKGRIALSTGAQVPCQLCQAPAIPDTTDARRRLAADARNALADLPAIVHDLRALASIDDVMISLDNDPPCSTEAIAAAAQAWSPTDPLVMDMRYANEAARNRQAAADRTLGEARRSVRSALDTTITRILPALLIDFDAVPAWLGLSREDFERLTLASPVWEQLQAPVKRWRTMDAMPKYLDCAPSCPGCGGQGCMIPPF